jgi:hypothetical protein
MHDDLGVAAVWKVGPAPQFGDERLEVVDLAVEHDDDRAVFVEQRLLAGRDVDDGQAAVAEPDAGLDVQAALVRAAMVLRLRSCAAAPVQHLREGTCQVDLVLHRLHAAHRAHQPMGSRALNGLSGNRISGHRRRCWKRRCVNTVVDLPKRMTRAPPTRSVR